MRETSPPTPPGLPSIEGYISIMRMQVINQHSCFPFALSGLSGRRCLFTVSLRMRFEPSHRRSHFYDPRMCWKVLPGFGIVHQNARNGVHSPSMLQLVSMHGISHWLAVTLCHGSALGVDQFVQFCNKNIEY